MAKRKQSNERQAVGKTPQVRTGGQMIIHNHLLEMHPSYRRSLMRLEQAATSRMTTAVTARTHVGEPIATIRRLNCDFVENNDQTIAGRKVFGEQKLDETTSLPCELSA